MDTKLNIGYSFWGFLSDYKIENGKEISTPDGNATYSYSIIYELQKRGHQVFAMMPDRDKESVKMFGKFAFKSFSQNTRWIAYNNLKQTHYENNHIIEYLFPKLDILLIEWRFPIIGRNINEDGTFTNILQKDLLYQESILRFYKGTNTKIIILDLDHKLTTIDEGKWYPDAIFETSEKPINNFIKRTSVKIPTIIDELLQFKTTNINKDKHLVYIGSRYERDEIIDKYIKNYALENKNKVHFYGNWRDYPNKLKESEERWKGIIFNNRITVKDFWNVYHDACFVPLLGKQSYFDSGFITARIFESVLFGSLPLGFKEHYGIEKYCLKTVDNYTEYKELIQPLLNGSINRDKLRKQQVEMLESFDVKYFVDKMMEVLWV